MRISFIPILYNRTSNITGHRRDLKKGAILSVFKWAPVTNDSREERLKLRSKRIAESESQAEYEHGEQPLTGLPIPSDSSNTGIICFGPPTLEKIINEMKEEAEQLKRELAVAKKKKNLF